jgi:hypothetical protein
MMTQSSLERLFSRFYKRVEEIREERGTVQERRREERGVIINKAHHH